MGREWLVVPGVNPEANVKDSSSFKPRPPACVVVVVVVVVVSAVSPTADPGMRFCTESFGKKRHCGVDTARGSPAPSLFFLMKAWVRLGSIRLVLRSLVALSLPLRCVQGQGSTSENTHLYILGFFIPPPNLDFQNKFTRNWESILPTKEE